MNDYKEMIEYLRATANEMTAADAHAFGVDDDVVVESEDAGMLRNAADAIEQLAKERDAAVAELHEVLGGGYYSGCEFCIKEEICDIHGHECRRCSGYDAWEWRGVQEDNDEID